MPQSEASVDLSTNRTASGPSNLSTCYTTQGIPSTAYEVAQQSDDAQVLQHT